MQPIGGSMEKNNEIKILETLGELIDKIEKIEGKISLLTKTSEHTERIKELLSKRKILTKKQILEEIGISGKAWRGWKEIADNLSSDPKINIHSGLGRYETIVIYLNEHDSLISMASRLFKSLIPDKKNNPRDYEIGYVCQMFNIDQEKAGQVLKEVQRIFEGRIRVGMGVFKRIY